MYTYVYIYIHILILRIYWTSHLVDPICVSSIVLRVYIYICTQSFNIIYFKLDRKWIIRLELDYPVPTGPSINLTWHCTILNPPVANCNISEAHGSLPIQSGVSGLLQYVAVILDLRSGPKKSKINMIPNSRGWDWCPNVSHHPTIGDLISNYSIWFGGFGDVKPIPNYWDINPNPWIDSPLDFPSRSIFWA